MVENKGPIFDIVRTRKMKRMVSGLITSAAALALFSEPISVSAQEKPKIELESQEDTTKLVEEIESSHQIKLEGEWSKKELIMLLKTFKKLPPNFTNGHPGMVTNIKKAGILEYDAYCQCAIYAHLGIEFSYEDVIISPDWFKDQKRLDLVITHELAHIASLITETPTTGLNRGQTIVWYHDEIESILGMEFESFRDVVWYKIENDFPRPYLYLSQYYRDQLSPYNKIHGPQSFEELFFDQRYTTLQKVDRWAYATTLRGGAPGEFIAVLSEWYIRGEKYFKERCDGIVDEKTAHKLYEFMRGKFFIGYEYNEFGELISAPTPTGNPR